MLQAGSDDLMQQAQVFIYANGNDLPPTSFDLDKSLLKDLLFNQSPSKVSSWVLAKFPPFIFVLVNKQKSSLATATAT